MTLPRDSYSGPVLAGQRWRQRGLSGHGTYLVTVLRMASRSVQLVVEGGGSGAGPSQASRAGRSGKIHVGKRYNVPLDIFRSNYVLVSQPKGYKAPTPLDAALGQVPRHPAQKLASTRPEDLYSHSALRNDPTPTECLDEQIDAFASILDHPAPPTETPEEAATEMAAPDPDPIPPPQEAPVSDSPAVAFRTAGGRLLADLEADLDRMRAEREEFWREVEDLDTKIEAAQGRLEAIRVAVEQAFALVVHPVPADRSVTVEPPAPDPLIVPARVAHAVAGMWSPQATAAPPEGVDPEDGTPEGEDPLGPRPTGQGRVSQRAWIEGYLRGEQLQGKREVRVADIAQGFAEEFGFPFNRARMNISAILVENNKRVPRLPSWPAMTRSEKGVYRFTDAQG